MLALRGPRGCLLLCSAVQVGGCLCVTDPRFGHRLRCAHNRIVNILKVYIERKNMQVQLIPFRKNII